MVVDKLSNCMRRHMSASVLLTLTNNWRQTNLLLADARGSCGMAKRDVIKCKGEET